MRCCLLLVCLLVRCFPVTGPSLVRLLVRLSLVHCWSVTGLLLVCRWSARVMAGGHGQEMVDGDGFHPGGDCFGQIFRKKLSQACLQ